MASLESIITYSTDTKLLELAKEDLTRQIESDETRLDSLTIEQYTAYRYLVYLKKVLDQNSKKYKKMH